MEPAPTPTPSTTPAADLPLDQRPWHGVPRHDIPWYPTVDADTCIGCSLCFVTCGRSVYEMDGRKATVVNPYQCMVGCSTCATVCPVQAITFPDRDVVWKVEREHKIFKAVRAEAAKKETQQELTDARHRAQTAIAAAPSGRVRFEVAGAFGDKRFLAQLEELVADAHADVVDLHLEVPTVRGLREGAPGRMTFELVAIEDPEALPALLVAVRALVRAGGLVAIAETAV